VTKLSLKDLRIFTIALSTGSMTAAAEHLSMSQSTVTQRVRNLEEQFGTKLIDRALRPLRPTPAGDVLRVRASQLLSDAEEAWLAVSRTPHNQLPELRGAVVESLAGSLIPSVIKSLSKSSPARNVSIRSGLALEHGQWLINREVDFLITTDTLEHVVDLERYLLLQEPFILIMPNKRSPVETGEPLLRLATDMPLIRFTLRSHIGGQIERHLSRLRMSIPRHYEFDSSESVVATVAAGVGWAILTPVCLLQGFRTGHRIKAMPFPGPQFLRQVTLVTHAGELGGLPWRIAQVCRDELNNYCLPKIHELTPWAASKISIGRNELVK
jgi:DNA-binding transcriptional LysR family regulator